MLVHRRGVAAAVVAALALTLCVTSAAPAVPCATEGVDAVPAAVGSVVLVLPVGTDVPATTALQNVAAAIATSIMPPANSTLAVGVVAYAGGGDVTATPLSTDVNAVVSTIENLPTGVTGSTGLTQALNEANTLLSTADTGPRVVLAVYTQADSGAAASAAALHRLGVTVYALDLGTGSNAIIGSYPAGTHTVRAPVGDDLYRVAGPVSADLQNALGVPTVGSACVMFGASHFMTMSGTAYTFQGFGEFTLLQTRFAGRSFTVQVRKARCTEGAQETDPASGTTCLRAFAVDDGSNTLTFEYLHAPNEVVWTVNGVAQSPVVTSASTGSLSAQLLHHMYDGITVEVGSNDHHAVTAHFAVNGSYIWVQPSLYATMTPALQLSAQDATGGLCGSFSGMRGYDLLMPDGSVAATPSSDCHVPSSRALAFGEAWRVAAVDSLMPLLTSESYATPPADFSPSVTDPSNTHAATASSGSCVGLSGFAFTACRADEAAGLGAYAAAEVQYLACASLCDTGSLPAPLATADACRCPIMDGWDVFAQPTAASPPGVVVYGRTQPTAYAQVSMGGAYTFQYGSAGVRVELQVSCDAGFGADAGQDMTMRYLVTEPVVVELRNASVGRALRASDRVLWEFVPPLPAGVTAVPDLLGAATLAPRFVADAPGTYTLRMAAYDGCNNTVDAVAVTLECEACEAAEPVAAAIATSAVTWQPSSAAFSVGSYVFPMSPDAAAELQFELGLNASLPRAPWNPAPLELQLAPGSGSRTVSAGHRRAEYNLVRVVRRGRDLGYSPVVSTSAYGGETSTWSVTDVTLEQTATGPDRRYANLASDATTATQTWSEATYRNHTVVDGATEQLCTVELTFVTEQVLDRSVSGVTVSVAPVGAVAPYECRSVLSLLAGYAADCPAAEPTEAYSVMVDCGTPPVARINCSEQFVGYSDVRGGFAPVQLTGAQSFDWDADGVNQLAYRWSVVSAPPRSTAVPAPLTGDTTTFEPDMEGEYTVMLDASDGCTNATSLLTVHATCSYPLTVAVAGPPSTVPVAGVPRNMPQLNATAVVSNLTGATFEWGVTQLGADPLLPIPPVTPTSLPPNQVLFYPSSCGHWRVAVNVTGACTTASAYSDFTVPCGDASISAAPSQTAATYDAVGQTWAADLNYTIANHIPNATFASVQWQVVSGPGTVVSAGPTGAELRTTQAGVTEVLVVAHDGATHAVEWVSDVVTIRSDCRPPSVSATAAAPVGSPVYAMVRNVAAPVQWTLLSRPQGSAATVFSGNSTDATLPFFGDTTGDYVLQVALGSPPDGCAWPSVLNVTVSFTCPAGEEGSGWAPTADASESVHNGAEFEAVALVNKGSYGKFAAADFTYRWVFRAAPPLSVYAPVFSDTTHTSAPVPQPGKVVPAPWVADGAVILEAENVTAVTRRVVQSVVVQDTADPSFCFYPDVAGDYEVELVQTHACGSRTSTVATTASCLGDLTVDVTSPATDFTVAIDGDFAVLRLSASADFSHKRRSRVAVYEWAWADGDNSVPADVLLTTDGLAASVWSPVPLAATLNLTVSDGCLTTTHQVPVAFTSADDGGVVTTAVRVAELQYPVLASHKFKLAATDGGAATGCALTDTSRTWQLVNYTAEFVPVSPGGGSDNGLGAGGIAAVTIAVVALVGAAGVCGFFYSRRRKEEAAAAGGGDDRGSQYGALDDGEAAGAGVGAGAGAAAVRATGGGGGGGSTTVTVGGAGRQQPRPAAPASPPVTASPRAGTYAASDIGASQDRQSFPAYTPPTRA